MKKIILSILIISFSLFSKAQETLYFPPTSGAEWDTLSITNIDWCQNKVDSLLDFLDSIDTKSFIVLKDGKIVVEKYFETYTIDSTFSWYSAAKSFRAVLLGKAQEENYLNIYDRTSEYIGSGWTSLSQLQEDSITIWNQLSMTSGLNEENFLCVNPSCLNYISTAGTRWAYHNGPYSLTKNVLEQATGLNHNVYSNNSIENPIGMNGVWLSFLGSSSYYSKARDMARFGLLILNKGIWDTNTILADTTYFNQMISSSQTLNPSYGYLWWLNGQNSYITTSSDEFTGPISPNAPTDIFVAAGSFGQFISISPGNNLIMVRQGLSDNGDLTEFEMHDEIWKRIQNLSCATTGIKTISKPRVKIFPNPTTNNITVDINIGNVSYITIYDMVGQCVLRKTIRNGESIDVSNFKQGIYVLKVESESINYSTKMVKN